MVLYSFSIDNQESSYQASLNEPWSCKARQGKAKRGGFCELDSEEDGGSLLYVRGRKAGKGVRGCVEVLGKGGEEEREREREGEKVDDVNVY